MAPQQVVTNVGVHENWASPDFGRTPEEIAVRFPGATGGRNAFINLSTAAAPVDLRPKVDNVLKPFLAAGTPKVYLSVKTQIAATRKGLWNARYTELGAHLGAINRSSRPTVVDFLAWHEPENDFASGTEYAEYANLVRKQIRAGGGSAVAVGYCAMAYQWSPNRASTKDAVPWRKCAMDFYSVDVYSGRSYPLEIILPEHSGFTRWYKEIADYGTRSGRYRVTERGFETPSATYPATRFYPRNQTINREFNWLRDNATGRLCHDYVYWNSSGTEGATGLLLDKTGEKVLATRIAEFYRLNHG